MKHNNPCGEIDVYNYAIKLNDFFVENGYEYKDVTYSGKVVHYLNTFFNLDDNENYSEDNFHNGVEFKRSGKPIFKWTFYNPGSNHKSLYDFLMNEITMLKLEMLK
jgi:hypothetical protein